MTTITRRFLLTLLVTLVFVTLPVSGAPLHTQVVINVDLTDQGKKFPRPSREKPAYYVPTILGYSEHGEIIAGETAPGRTEVIRQLGKALAQEGYVLQALRPDANTTLPSLVLAFEWGYLNPKLVDFGEDPHAPPDSRGETPRIKADFNQKEMLTLVAGASIYRGILYSQSDWDKLTEAVQEGRYYIIISAYDFAASLKNEKILLWRARTSTGRQGVTMDNVVSALVSSVAPILGRDLERPQFSTAPLREGRVEIGTPTVVTQSPKPPGTVPGDSPKPGQKK